MTLFAAPSGTPRRLELVVPGPSSPVSYTSLDWAPGSRRFLVKHEAEGDPSFIVGDIVNETVLEQIAPTPVDYGRFARDTRAVCTRVVEQQPFAALSQHVAFLF